MKNLLALLILFSTMLTKQPEYISIEHIGISDKPIATVIISKDSIVSSDAENFTVTSEDYAVLKGVILSNTKADYKGHEFGSFKITVKSTTEKHLSYYFNRKKSIELFNKLIKTLEKENANKDLLSRLEIVKKRIVY